MLTIVIGRSFCKRFVILLVFIYFSFCFCYYAGGDDTDHITAHRINNQEQQPGCCQSNDSFSKFTANDFFIEITDKRIEKRLTSQFKPDVMLAEIGCGFLTIPFKADILKSVLDFHPEAV